MKYKLKIKKLHLIIILFLINFYINFSYDFNFFVHNTYSISSKEKNIKVNLKFIKNYGDIENIKYMFSKKSNNEYIIKIVSHKNELITFIRFFAVIEKLKSKNYIYFKELFTSEKYRKQGFATFLLANTIALIKNNLNYFQNPRIIIGVNKTKKKENSNNRSSIYDLFGENSETNSLYNKIPFLQYKSTYFRLDSIIFHNDIDYEVEFREEEIKESCLGFCYKFLISTKDRLFLKPRFIKK
jgi:GNAT superfamily N-acetyltransferase